MNRDSASPRGTARVPHSKTVHLRLPPACLERGTLVSVLRNLLAGAETRQPLRS